MVTAKSRKNSVWRSGFTRVCLASRVPPTNRTRVASLSFLEGASLLGQGRLLRRGRAEAGAGGRDGLRVRGPRPVLGRRGHGRVPWHRHLREDDGVVGRHLNGLEDLLRQHDQVEAVLGAVQDDDHVAGGQELGVDDPGGLVAGGAPPRRDGPRLAGQEDRAPLRALEHPHAVLAWRQGKGRGRELT